MAGRSSKNEDVQQERRQWAAILLATFLVFIADSQLPDAVAGGVPYIAVVWLAYGLRNPQMILWIAGGCSLLAAANVSYSALQSDYLHSLTNLGLSMFAIWMTAALCMRVKQGEQSLMEREQSQREILESALDATVSMDAQGSIVEWSSQAGRIFGWSKEEVLGRDLADLVIPEKDHLAHREGLQRYISTGEGRVVGKRLELIARRRSGQEFPIELTLTATYLGPRMMFHAFIRDISERQAMMEQLREGREQLQLVLDSTAEAIYGIDDHGKCAFCNPACVAMLGYSSADELIGRHMHGLIHQKNEDGSPYVETDSPIYRSLQRSEATHVDDEVLWRKDGSSFPAEYWAHPVVRNGQVIGAVVTFFDITDRKEREAAMKLAVEGAEHAKQLAETALRVRSEFLANVSHELRTPMNSILGMLQLALDDELPSVLRDYLSTAKDSADSLLQLLNDILDFSRIDSGKFSIEELPFELRETLHEALKTISDKAFAKGLELTCAIAPDVPESLIGDGGRLRQIVLNLISNAIKFTDQGEVLVRVGVDLLLQREVRLSISVQDTGIGIAPEDQRRIFQAFTQVDSTATRTHGGVGLGLAICHQLLHHMGGRLSVESRPGKGSTFYVTVTFRRREKSLSRSAAAPQSLYGLPILIVDDNETSRHILEEVLRDASMNPFSCADGEEALGLLQKGVEQNRPFRLVIIDALMPGMDGFTLLEQIGSNPVLRQTPAVMMMSSADRQTFADRERDAPITAVVTKPVAQADLLEAVMNSQNVPGPLSKEEVPLPSQPRCNPLSILLTEDVPANQKVVTSMLRKRGHGVEIAQNGREALEFVRTRPFDVILMDVQMPIMDGFQAAKAIRNIEPELGRRTPIIAITAHAMRGDRERCLEAGMDGYVAKPIDVLELMEMVEDLGRTKRAPRIADASGQIVDIPSALRRLGGDKELLQDFVQVYFEDSPAMMTRLRQAVTEGNAHELHQSAHALKGLISNFNAQAAVDAAFRLEKMGRAADLGTSAVALEQLEARIAELNQALQEFRRD